MKCIINIARYASTYCRKLACNPVNENKIITGNEALKIYNTELGKNFGVKSNINEAEKTFKDKTECPALILKTSSAVFSVIERESFRKKIKYNYYIKL